MRKFIFTLVIVLFVNCTLSIELCFGQWVKMSNGMGTDSIVTGLTAIGNYIFADASAGSSPAVNRVYLNINNGVTWSPTSLALSSKEINCLASLGTTLYAGADSCIWLSTNNGTTWTRTLMGQDILGLNVLGNDIYAGTYYYTGNYGAFRSIDNGANWTYCGLNGRTVYTFAKLGNNLFAGRKIDGVWLSTNNGTNWTQTSLNNREVHALATIGTTLFAGSDSGVFISTNNGTSWTQSSLNNKYIATLVVSGNNIFAGAFGGGVYLSTNNGVSWIQKNQGFNGVSSVFILLVANDYIYAGTPGQFVWRRSLSEIIGVQNISTEIPSAFSLSQNYPNPFNPTTNLKFDVARVGDVKIIVYDAMGREVQTLVNESLQPGTYETSFDGSQLTSGVYFYKITAGNFTETKRMILMK